MKPYTSVPLSLFFLSSLIFLSFSQNTTVWPPYLANLTQLNCSNMNTEANFCTMQNTVSSGFVWDNPNSTIEFTGFVVNLRGNENCQIYIRARNVWFEHSNITGCDIIINASLSVKLDNSILSVDGSISLGPGYVEDSDIGNSYGGSGGYCEDGLAPDNTYGDFMTPFDDDVNAFGTGGADNYSLGGGRIVIITAEFSAVGSAVTSNGYPQYCLSNQTSAKGGTGGYIYLNAQSTLVPYLQNVISAQGGLGCQNTSFGGSGGRVIISADPGLGDKFNVMINGGTAAQPCSTGASGTLYCQNYSTVAPNALFIAQNAQAGITIPTPTYVNLTGRENLTVMGGPGATIAVQSPGEDSGPIELQSLLIFNETRFIYSVGTEQSDTDLDISVNGVLSIEHSEIWCDCDLTLQVQSMMAVSKQSFITSGTSGATINLNVSTLTLENSSILFSEISPLLQIQQMSSQTNTSDDSSSSYSDFSDSSFEELTDILFSSRGYLPLTSLIINAGQTTVSSAFIQSSFIYLNTGELEHDGLITATNQTCTSQSLPIRTQAVNPALYNLDINQMASAFNSQDPSDFIDDYIFQDYTVMVIAQDQATINGAIQGSRIGLFANQLNISSTGNVSAAGLGCPSNQGPGFGVMGTDFGSTCASAGGSSGAIGGIGLTIGSADDASQCLSQLETAPLVYGDPQNPLYEGSGGGSYNGIGGGSGGGVIILGALNTLNIEGNVNASGTAPNSTESGSTSPNGAGAGAGGSVQLYMNQLVGTGSITANGGSIPSGSWGGVGSGGRLSINFLEWSQILSTTDTPVLPSILVNAGVHYGATEAGSGLIPLMILSGNGSLSSTPCPPGYIGLFCEPCNGSVYKADFGSNQCYPCTIPSGATLSNEFAQQSYICDFSCEYEINIGGTTTCVSNMIIYNIHNGGMYAGLFAIGAAILVGMAFTASVVVKRRKEKCKKKPVFSSASDLTLTDAADFKMKGKHFTNNHMQRINIFGDNTPESRWFINTDTFNLRELEKIRDKIDHLIKRINRTTGWRKSWVYFLKFFVIAYPPLYFYLLQKFRGKLYRRVNTLIKEINDEFRKDSVLRSFPEYCIVLNVDKHLSSGYLDLFQVNGDYSARNNLLPVSITLTGNGKFSSPYHVDKCDPMLEHLVVNWAPKNCLVADEEITFFRYEFRRFLTKFNKKAKYIDYSACFKNFQSNLAETIKEVTKFKEIFANNYSLYFNLFVFEIPRFALDETNAIQPLLQSPVRVTILEESEGDEFHDLAKRIQRLKTEDEFDVKLYLIVNSSRDLQGVSQRVANKRATSVFPLMEEKLEVVNRSSQPKSTNLEELKQSFYNKLDEISFNIETGIPRQMGDEGPKKKKQKISSAKKKVYAISRKYFKGVNTVFNALVGFKKSQKIVNIYATISILLIVNLGFLWFRAVSIFELSLDSYLWLVWFPFPLVMVFAPIYGLLGVISGNSRITLYFALLNSCCLVNHVVSFIIVATVSYNSLIMYIFEGLTCLLYLLTLFACKYLLPLQS